MPRVCILELNTTGPDLTQLVGNILLALITISDRSDKTPPSPSRRDEKSTTMSGLSCELGPRTRSALPLPADDPAISIPPGHVSIYHPGYEPDREMIHFLAYNKSQDGTRWLDYNFALDMCMAMTGHRAQGFFTLERAPNAPKAGIQQSALVEGVKYYFQVGAEDSDTPNVYPVIRSFRDYVFSSDHVGEHWRAAVPNSGIEKGQPPEACILTGHWPHAQDAHLLPSTEWQYWKANGLHRYALQPGPRTQGRETSTRSNMVKLSPTLHTMFDAGHFVLIPAGGKLQSQWIRASDRMALELHSRPVRGGCHLLSPEYAYLACVYRVMGLMQETFLERGNVKTLVTTSEGRNIQMSGLELAEYRDQQARNTSPTKSSSRSTSPRKRTRVTAEDNESLESSHIIDLDDIEPSSDSGVDTEEWTRGRRRTTYLEAMRRGHEKKRRKLVAEHPDDPSTLHT